jgi:hypothetical protein
MTVRNILLILAITMLFGLVATTEAEMPKEQIYSLFNQANEAFRQANSITDDPDRARKLYERAILSYEKVIHNGKIENPKLYYNLANAYFLKEDIGRAILNYRRAEKLDRADTNIQKNLSFARSRRVDKVRIKTEKRVLQTLFFWHYDFSTRTKFVLSCVFFAIVCVGLTVMVWFGRSPGWTAASVIAGLLMVVFLVSVVLDSGAETSHVGGVITTSEVIARQGDGQNYSPSFKEPLHEGTEFDLLESRLGWFHIELFDDSDTWIPDDSAELM